MWTSSSLCDFSITTYVHNNFVLCQLICMSVWYILFVIIYILYVWQLMCIIDSIFFGNSYLNVWQLLFLWQFVYELMCMTPSFLIYVYDILLLWQLIYMTDSILWELITNYVFVTILFLWQLINIFLWEPLSYICGNLYMYIVATSSIISNSNLHISCY